MNATNTTENSRPNWVMCPCCVPTTLEDNHFDIEVSERARRDNLRGGSVYVYGTTYFPYRFMEPPTISVLILVRFSDVEKFEVYNIG